ncbi:hypothetical protein XH83_39065 (plasmid) [Bradyrhizobium sp. CCBAU 53351]|uniref:Uncharacterized protein n=2 Tax=Bradyrhizobium TaxID=374 RepID=A0AAE5X8J3_9BRAD|nr:hypothetical protein X265_36915 [Bradyrhizobium guangdongense]QAU50758.1 hypothetical protein XH91_36125 [Bradyrhizobium guangzhouense]QOZ49650.1 hypothetical protein XH89_40135 [Bradyrhizobium sp. CCBAU 53340]QOZ56769.1 hypothetical protein XH90_35925 [Bradyrhizobium sp. CCBAU 53338]QOZ81410.1 hypothetical protein XH83_39065 [Bradyrhizobium sp. CCBAU 53351]
MFQLQSTSSLGTGLVVGQVAYPHHTAAQVNLDSDTDTLTARTHGEPGYRTSRLTKAVCMLGAR